MKKFALGALLLGLGVFLTGCNDTAKQKDKSERTVNTDQDTGATTIKKEEEHTATDDETGAKVETSVDEKTTIKPGDDENDAGLDNDKAPGDTVPNDAAPGDAIPDSTEPTTPDDSAPSEK
jgi:hypothetical protein